MKKLFTLFFALIIALSVSLPAFADMGGPEYKPISAVVTAYDSADIYNYGQYSDDLTVVGSIAEGEKIDVMELGDEYCYVSNNDNNFWIRTQDIYLESKTFVVKANGGLNFRSWPSTDSELVLKKPIADGTTIIVISYDYSGDWAYIRHLGKYGWVSAKYIIDAATTTVATTESTTVTTAEATTEATSQKTTATEEAAKTSAQSGDTTIESKAANANVNSTDKLAYLKGVLNSDIDMFGLKVKCLWLFVAGAALILLLLIIIIILLAVRLKKSKAVPEQAYPTQFYAQPSYQSEPQPTPDFGLNMPEQSTDNRQAAQNDIQQPDMPARDEQQSGDVPLRFDPTFEDNTASNFDEAQNTSGNRLDDETPDNALPEEKNE